MATASLAQVNRSWLNLQKHEGISWEAQTTPRAIEKCSGYRGKPSRVDTRKIRGKGRDKAAWRKGHRLSNNDKKRIWNRFQAVVGENALCCGKCRDILRNDIAQFDVETVTVEIPSLDVLDDIPMGYDSGSISDDDDDSKQPASERYRNPTVDIAKISDPEIMIYCGLNKEDLLHILKQTNDGLKGKKGDDKLSLEQLFITLTIWRQNLRYRVAAAMFGYKGPGSIVYVVDKVCFL